MKAKHVAGHLRVIYDNKAKAAGYIDWQAFLDDLQLGDEPAGDAYLVLKDEIEGNQGQKDSLPRGRRS